MELFLTEQNNNIINEERVVVYCEKSGKHYTTFIVGLNSSDDEYKKILQILTKKFGCGGAIKNIIYEGKDGTKAITIQGNFVVKTGEHLKKLNIKNLVVKELVQ
jgi:translation initiation factor 1 (eIF-1/SUI1)